MITAGPPFIILKIYKQILFRQKVNIFCVKDLSAIKFQPFSAYISRRRLARQKMRRGKKADNVKRNSLNLPRVISHCDDDDNDRRKKSAE